MGRDPFTIYRDFKRNRYSDTELPQLNGYHALVAQDKYEHRRAIHPKMLVYPELKEAIEDRLKVGWSAEQISGEFSAWKHLKAGIVADAWFCNPQAPYQKGTVENTKNRLRRYLPRSTERSGGQSRTDWFEMEEAAKDLHMQKSKRGCE